MTQISSIRFIKEAELDELVLLCEAHAHFEKSSFEPKGKRQKLQQALFKPDPDLYCLVVERGGVLLGYASYMVQFSTWDAAPYIYMDCLYLKPSVRGLGIGEQLINRIKVEAIGLGCHLIQWQTPTFNKRAQKFYDRMGGVSKSKERYFLSV